MRSISGLCIARLFTSGDETVGSLHARALQCRGGNAALANSYEQSQLVDSQGERLAEHMLLHDVLGSVEAFDSDGSTPTLMLTLVVLGASSLRCCLRQWPANEACGVDDVVDAVLKFEHDASLASRPRAAAVERGIPGHVRGHVISWLAEVCDVMAMDDLLLHGTVMTLDRFAAAAAIPCPERLLCRYTLAALSAEIKVNANKDDFSNEYFTRLLEHVSQGHEPLSEILKAEYEILRALEFKVGRPNPFCFLRGMAIRISTPPVSSADAMWLGTSRMLIELALYDIGLQYNHDPLAIAAAALTSALVAGAGPSGFNASLDELRTQRTRVLGDMSSYCRDVGLSWQFAACERELLTLWRDCLQGTSPWTRCYYQLSVRYARPRNAPSTGLGGAAAIVIGNGAPALNPEIGLAHLDALQHHVDATYDSNGRVRAPCSDADRSSGRPLRTTCNKDNGSLAALQPSNEPATKRPRRGLRFTLSDGSQPRFLDHAWQDLLGLRPIEAGAVRAHDPARQSSSSMLKSGPAQVQKGLRGVKRGLRQALSDGADPLTRTGDIGSCLLDGEDAAERSFASV